MKPLCCVLFLLSSLTVASAQQQSASGASPSASPLVTAGSRAEGVRFASPGSVVQIHLQVYSDTGQVLFDAASKGNVLDWGVQDGSGTRLAAGSYLCVVTVKSLSGKLGQRITGLVVQEQQAELRAIEATQLSAAQQREVGPVEEDAAIAILKENEGEAATVISHNGEEGQITRGRGALSFRVGDFFRGTDREQMRLTAEGNLGIGIAHPQVRLEVDGLIRSTQGIVFPDGTVQYSAARKTLGATSSRAGEAQKGKAGQEDVSPQAAGTGTQNRIAKWLDNAGNLGDSVITESSSRIGISAANPGEKLSIGYGSNTDMSVGSVTGNKSYWGSYFDNVALAINRRVSDGVFANPNLPTSSIGLFTSNGDSSIRFGTSNVNNQLDPERMRIDKNGRVGIGTTAPLFLLDVAGAINTSTQYNIAGYRVLSTPGLNTFVGQHAGESHTSGDYNAFFGRLAGNQNTTGESNSIFGDLAGYVSSGSFNSFFGTNAGRNTQGNYNAFFGKDAGYGNTTGSNNAFFGSEAGFVSSGSNNAFFGSGAGRSNSGGDNSFFGHQSGLSNTGSNNAFFGRNTGPNNTGSHNAFFGFFAGQANTSGFENAFFGDSAGTSNINGVENAYFGAGAGQSATNACCNSFVGWHAGFNTTGSANTFFGESAGANNKDGSSNTFIGYESGFNAPDSTGNQNTLLGMSARVNAGLSNATAIGAKAYVTQSNSLVLGSIAGVGPGSADTKVGIGTTAPQGRMHVVTLNATNPLSVSAWDDRHFVVGADANQGGIALSYGNGIGYIFALSPNNAWRDLVLGGNGRVGIGRVPVQTLDVNGTIHSSGDIETDTCIRASGGFAGGTCASDLRFKRDIKAFPRMLEKIAQLQPVDFRWRTEQFPERHFGSEWAYGLLAQDVEKVLPELVAQDESGYKAVNYGKLPMLMLQAIKDLKAENDSLRQQNARLQKQNAGIDARLTAVEQRIKHANFKHGARRNHRVAAKRVAAN